MYSVLKLTLYWILKTETIKSKKSGKLSRTLKGKKLVICLTLYKT